MLDQFLKGELSINGAEYYNWNDHAISVTGQQCHSMYRLITAKLHRMKNKPHIEY